MTPGKAVQQDTLVLQERLVSILQRRPEPILPSLRVRQIGPPDVVVLRHACLV